MTRSSISVFLLAVIGTLGAGDRSLAAYPGEIIPQTAARRHGLARPWFTQVQLDRTRARVSEIVLHGGTLFVVTDQAVVHAMDAETGQTLWAKEVGRRGHPSLTPAVNDSFLAVVNGSFLYVVNRFNGKLLWKRQLESVPGAGAALSDQRAYVPMVTGKILCYQLEKMKDPLEELGKTPEEEQGELTSEEEEALEAERREAIQIEQEYVRPLACQSFGRSLIQPVVTRQVEGEEYVTWPTDRGFLFLGRLDEINNQFGLLWKLETEGGIAAQPAYLPPDPDILGDTGIIYAASGDGFVHAIGEEGGDLLWQFSTAESILQPPVVIGQSIYVVTEPGRIYSIDAKSGAEQWWTYPFAQFVAASKERVYVADKLGRLVVLNAATGARLDMIATDGLDIKVLNTETDRIYVATATGLVQCLHEVELAEPIHHAELAKAAAVEVGPEAAVPPAGQVPPGPEAKPAAPSAEEIFGAPPKKPAADEGNPFVPPQP